jgi:hypothetical protein
MKSGRGLTRGEQTTTSGVTRAGGRGGRVQGWSGCRTSRMEGGARVWHIEEFMEESHC